MQTDYIQRVLERTIEIQQIPAPTFEEGERAEFVARAFRDEGLGRVEIDPVGNVYGCLSGENSEKFLVVSAHTDTVFPQHTDLSVRRRAGRISGPGIGDNSLGVAGLFGLLWALQDQKIRLPGDLWLVANVGEEGLGDLYGMHKVVERFGGNPLGYVILEGLAFGRLYHRGLGVKRYKITVNTQGGHSWVDYGMPSAVHELASLVATLLKFKLSKRPRTTMNVGKISGGVSINTIAPSASIELDVRSEDGKVLNQICKKVEQAISQAEKSGVKYSVEVIGNREFGEIPRNHPLVKIGVNAIRRQGVEPELLIGSTDANAALSKGFPAICIGLANGGAAHTESEFMLTANLPRGLAQLLEIVEQGFNQLPS
jgi:acetylornithine deacetylase/succinyl-diaminopimelate desuccinylase-like protein